MKQITSILAILIPLYANAKCKGFEYGAPNFCVKIHTTKILDKSDTCIVEANVSEIKETLPSGRTYEYGLKKLKDSKTIFIEVGISNCKENEDFSGVLIEYCHDNISPWERIRGLLGIPIKNPNYRFNLNPEIFDNLGKKIEISCN